MDILPSGSVNRGNNTIPTFRINPSDGSDTQSEHDSDVLKYCKYCDSKFHDLHVRRSCHMKTIILIWPRIIFSWSSQTCRVFNHKIRQLDDRKKMRLIHTSSFRESSHEIFFKKYCPENDFHIQIEKYIDVSNLTLSKDWQISLKSVNKYLIDSKKNQQDVTDSKLSEWL